MAAKLDRGIGSEVEGFVDARCQLRDEDRLREIELFCNRLHLGSWQRDLSDDDSSLVSSEAISAKCSCDIDLIMGLCNGLISIALFGEVLELPLHEPLKAGERLGHILSAKAEAEIVAGEVVDRAGEEQDTLFLDEIFGKLANGNRGQELREGS